MQCFPKTPLPNSKWDGWEIGKALNLDETKIFLRKKYLTRKGYS